MRGDCLKCLCGYLIRKINRLDIVGNLKCDLFDLFVVGVLIVDDVVGACKDECVSKIVVLHKLMTSAAY